MISFPVIVSQPAPQPKPKKVVLGKSLAAMCGIKNFALKLSPPETLSMWDLYNPFSANLFIFILTSYAVLLEEPVCTLKLEPIQELSEEEKGKRDSETEPVDCMLSAWMRQSVVGSLFLRVIWPSNIFKMPWLNQKRWRLSTQITALVTSWG